MGGHSHSKGRGFESRHCILDGHFSHIFVVKICHVYLKRPKINEKEAGVGPFFKKLTLSAFTITSHNYQLLGKILSIVINLAGLQYN